MAPSSSGRPGGAGEGRGAAWPALARLAGATGGPSLRALDAIHVAAALRLGPEIEVFVTYDDRQAEAARAAGFDVVSPTA
jgi:predicted nucleic acid-binding protein